jgi:hypothetical protein
MVLLNLDSSSSSPYYAEIRESNNFIVNQAGLA